VDFRNHHDNYYVKELAIKIINKHSSTYKHVAKYSFIRHQYNRDT
jgi:hypothetical protein